MRFLAANDRTCMFFPELVTVAFDARAELAYKV